MTSYYHWLGIEAEDDVEAVKNRLEAVVEQMRARNLPPYAAGERIAIAWPKSWRSVAHNMGHL